MARFSTAALGLTLACLAFSAGRSAGVSAEYNPVRLHPSSLGSATSRLIVGFGARDSTSAAGANATSKQALPPPSSDVAGLARRVGLDMARSRQIALNMHVLVLKQVLYGADVQAALAKLRADPSVKFAEVDQRRYPHTVPDDPLFFPQPGVASGQWYLMTPSAATVTVEGNQTIDLSATDAVSAWTTTAAVALAAGGSGSTGAAGTVIADIDTGVRFDHPDLLRSGQGGRLLPGYDFVEQDYSSTGLALGTFLIANDGDGWDPDPSDPGDWINSTDQQNPLFPAASCTVADSTWHGTRVVGILGALTNNGVGIAGIAWNSSWVLPVRALGKCGGYDSDIIAGMEWAAGISVPGVPDNPYPANIINLSLGGSGSCPSDYVDAINQLTAKGVLIVASAGNGGASVDAPANCPGVLGVAGLRNVGTKVGYSSYGSEVGIAAPAGNCVTTSGPCLRSLDTTTNTGLTVPAANSYTNEINPNLGTSFSAPIVAGIAGLMHNVNANLTPAQLIARLQLGAVAFPQPTGTPVCSAATANSQECTCTTTTCGAGMVNALNAVTEAQRPIAAVLLPSTIAAGSNAQFDASGSAASCGRTLRSYAWTASGGVTLVSGASTAKITIVPGTSGTITLTVTDNTGATDSATVTLGATSATSTAPATAGAQACPASVSVTPVAPTVSQAFSPTKQGATIASLLTITLTNSNAFALTQSNFSDTLPSGLVIAGSPAPTTTCAGVGELTTSAAVASLAGAIIPALGSCTITLSVSSTTAGAYVNTIPANALTTGPAGGNTSASSATLTVAAPAAPTVSESFAPSSIGQNGVSTLTLILGNSNTFALTKAALTDALPGGITIKSSPAATSTCGGALSAASSTVALTGATIPAGSSCTVTVTVTGATAGSYINTLAANALTTVPGGGNTAPASAALTVTASGGGGGGAVDWWDMMFVVGVILAGRRSLGRRPPRG